MNQPEDAATDAAILLDDVHLKLTSAAGEVNILRGIDLTVAAGEAIGVIGPSGGGKSTMMMVIAGLEKITSGRVCTAGVDLNGLDEDALARFRRDHVGVVFQDFHLIPTMTALENVAVPLEFGGAGDAFERARRQLQAVGLDHRLEHYPGQLSGGEQQMVAMGRALMSNPRVLLMDEPSMGLAPALVQTNFELIKQIHEEGVAIFMVEQNANMALSIADRGWVLQTGRVVLDDTAGALLIHPELRASYLGEA